MNYYTGGDNNCTAGFNLNNDAVQLHNHILLQRLGSFGRRGCKKNSNSSDKPAATLQKKKIWHCVLITNCANDVKSIRNFISQLQNKQTGFCCSTLIIFLGEI